MLLIMLFVVNDAGVCCLCCWCLLLMILVFVVNDVDMCCGGDDTNIKNGDINNDYASNNTSGASVDDAGDDDVDGRIWSWS